MAGGPKPGGTGPLVEVLRGVRLALLNKTDCDDRVYWSLSTALQQSNGPDGVAKGNLPAIGLQLISETTKVLDGSNEAPLEYECMHEVGIVVLVERRPELATGASSGTDLIESETEAAARLADEVKRLMHAHPTLPTTNVPEGPACGVRYVRSDYDAEGNAAAVMLVVRVVFELRYCLAVPEAGALAAVPFETIEIDYRTPQPVNPANPSLTRDLVAPAQS